MRGAEEWEKAADDRRRGIAVAVAFDRAILTRAIVQYGLASRQAAATFLLVLLGLPLAALGEALRRDATSARPLQVSIASLLGAGNLAGLLADLRALAGGAPRWGVSLPSLIASTRASSRG
jgi:uncharacterized oligopeptide transporter (OPT) family protein